jgi:hypothetical protein
VAAVEQLVQLLVAEGLAAAALYPEQMVSALLDQFSLYLRQICINQHTQ